jgi:hypothetical protein
MSRACFIFKNFTYLLISFGLLIGLFSQNLAYGAPLGFSTTEWEKIVKAAIQEGYARNSNGAEKLAPALSTMKSVFEEVGIKEPSAKQLFRAISHFTSEAGFLSLTPEQTNKSLLQTITATKSLGIKMASREDLEKLDD